MAEMNETRDNDQLLLLHLSDIHFREPYCLNLDTDQDYPVRAALLNDIHTMVGRLGQVDAILVSGDIAHKGHPDEYAVAAKWLSDVTSIVGCEQTDIYTVPGNHDVNRVLAEGREIQKIRKLISECDAGAPRDKKLHDTLIDPLLGTKLLSHMTEYNQFAASFGCDLNAGQPFWIEELQLSPGWKLKMHGLTTTLLSGPDDDVKGDLYLGALQQAFSPDDGIVRLAILHHPPDWLSDQDSLDDALWDRCALHLLGHKHRQRYLPGVNGVRLASGAVNPSRTDGNWEPGYNLVKLQINEDAGRHSLLIESYLRVWQTSPDRFVAKISEDDKNVFIHKVPLRRRPLPISTKNVKGAPETEGKIMASETDKENELTNIGSGESMNGMSATSPSRRGLVFKFWELSPSQRRKTMQKLELLEEIDDQLPETLRYRLAFKRAHERNMIYEIEKAVNQLLTK